MEDDGMKWTYDPSVDALMITLLPGKRSKRAEELRPGPNL